MSVYALLLSGSTKQLDAVHVIVWFKLVSNLPVTTGGIAKR